MCRGELKVFSAEEYPEENRQQTFGGHKGSKHILKCPIVVMRHPLHNVKLCSSRAGYRTVPAVTHTPVQVTCVKTLPGYQKGDKALWQTREGEQHT